MTTTWVTGTPGYSAIRNPFEHRFTALGVERRLDDHNPVLLFDDQRVVTSSEEQVDPRLNRGRDHGQLGTSSTRPTDVPCSWNWLLRSPKSASSAS